MKVVVGDITVTICHATYNFLVYQAFEGDNGGDGYLGRR